MTIAVEVCKGYKYYGKTNLDPHKKIVLNHLDMKVEYGSIYGLLGASGCGKTTLISCIVGSKKLNDGDLHVLGGKPGSAQSGVPGPKLGYMPQEVALVKQLTVKETIYYFASIYGMPLQKIREQYKFLKELLELPDCDKRIEICSGGQQRRVSFAVAVVHAPELLILDEPTVGLDPLLRERIWDFLLHKVKSTKTAVLLTTHYIEETKQATKIGFMRGGVLLAEDSPNNIISTFNTDTLEEAFLMLCKKQGSEEMPHQNVVKIETNTMELNKRVPVTNEEIQQVSEVVTSENGKSINNDNSNNNGSMNKKEQIIKDLFTSRTRMKAMLVKNYTQMIRQPVALFCFLFCSTLAFACFYLAIGGDPKYLKLAIVNEEVGNYKDCLNDTLITTFRHEEICEWKKLSCRYIDTIGDEVAEKIYYDSYEEAYKEARRGRLAGIMRFTPNFTEALFDIFLNGVDADNSSFDAKEISIYLDQSDKQISSFLIRKLYFAYKRFAEELMIDCQYPKALASSPLQLLEPIYGTHDEKFTAFIAPGIAVTWMFFFPMIMSLSVFIDDRSEGIWDRVLAAGVKPTEFLLAHIITQSVIMIIQCSGIIFLAAVVFGIENHGCSFTAIFLLLLIGFLGICHGIVSSIFCDTYEESALLGTGSFFAIIMLGSIIWPLEGAPLVLRGIGYILPFAKPSTSLRNILSKGFSITHPGVLTGYAIVLTWISGFIILGLLGLKLKK